MNSLLQYIYKSSPVFVKSILVSIKGLHNKYQRKGGNYKAYCKAYAESYYWPLDDILTYQKINLKQLLLQAKNKTNYYNEVLDIDLNQLDSVSSLEQMSSFLQTIPILEKETLKSRTKEFFVNDLQSDYKSLTSGTTGSPLAVFYDKDSLRKSFALLRRFYNQIGLKENYKSVRFSGNRIIHPTRKKTKYWVHNYSENQLLMSTYHLSLKNIPYYLEKLNSFKPDLLDGYPSAILTLASFILDKRIKLDFQLTAITTTAETLYSKDRELIQKAFSCKVYNQYASSEGIPFITECKFNKLHLNLDSGIFEFINNNEIINDYFEGEVELLVTSFRQDKTPLIRYRTGDYVKLSRTKQKRCSCGSYFPVVEEILGRKQEYLYSTDGAPISMVGYRIFKYLNDVRRSQIIQVAKNQVKILLEIEPEFKESEIENLIKLTKEVLGEDMNVLVDIVDAIPLSSNGKFQSVVRKIEIPENWN